MKKKIIFTVGLSCLLTFTSCSTASANNEDFSNLEICQFGEVNCIPYNDLETLEEESDVIVIGAFKDNSEQKEVYQYNDHFQKDVLTVVISTNKIEISKVIKGDVKEGDFLSISQDYGIVDDKYVTLSHLTPMIKGDQWLFFLTKNTKELRAGTYSCTGDADGRYPLKDFSYKKIALTDFEDYGVLFKEDFKENIYNEILKKYSF